MDPETQTWIALSIVALTVAIFAWRIIAKKRRGGLPSCGGGCGCNRPLSKR